MPADPRSPFEGVAALRLRPRFFVIAALLVACGAQFCWYMTDHALEGVRIAAKAAARGWELPNIGGASPSVAFLFALAMAALFCSRVLSGLLGMRQMKREVPVRLGVREDHLLVDGTPAASLGALSSVLVVPGGGETRTVVLERRRRPALELRVRDDEHAAALVRALGLGPTQRAASYRLPAQPGSWGRKMQIALEALVPALAVLGPFGLHLLLGDAAYFPTDASYLSVLLVMTAIGVLYAALMARRPRLVVGTDGVSLVSARRSRFVPYHALAGAREKRPDRLMVTLTNGELFSFVALDPQGIVARILEAKAAARSEADAETSLLRGSGSTAERIRALRVLGRDKEQDYRSSPLTTEQLWQTFESSAADPESRAGAAIALRARLDASCLPRLRVVASTTANPELRVAIERAASGDDAALEEALAALESSEGETHDGRRELGPAPGDA